MSWACVAAVRRALARRAALLATVLVVAGRYVAAFPERDVPPEPAPCGRSLGELAMPFEANGGQLAADVAFAAHGSGATLFVTRQGQLVHVLAGKRSSRPAAAGDRLAAACSEKGAPGWSLVETLVGAKTWPPQGCNSSVTRVSRFAGGDPHRWRAAIDTYDRVSLGEAWPGVGVELVVHGAGVEKLFTVAPGGDVGRIRVAVGGATSLRAGSDGVLVAGTGVGPVAFTAPVAYQVIGGRRRPVAVRYRVEGGAYSFMVGRYDSGAALVIDPIVQATYLGGSASDRADAMVLGAGGDVYIAGKAGSPDYPGTAGGAQPVLTPGAAFPVDAFVARLSGDLKTLKQATFLGGSGYDAGLATAVDGAGRVLLLGMTRSTDLPGTAGGAQPHHGADGGANDAFVALLSQDLRTLVQATYLGGSREDVLSGVAVASAGDVFVVGMASSTDFPGTAGGARPFHASDNSGEDGVVVRMSGDLKVIRQASYLGGNTQDRVVSVAIGNGAVYVAGFTSSTDLPGAAGGAQPLHSPVAGFDTFLASLSADLKALAQTTYFGGSGGEYPRGVALDRGGNVVVAGLTGSGNLPGTAGGAQPSHSATAGNDGFLARFSPDLKAIVQATYLGGNAWDDPYALALANDGTIYVAGHTMSSDLPGTSGGVQAQHSADAGSADSFVARFAPDLKTLLQATYLGGLGGDYGTALALAGNGDVYVAGYASSSDFPGTSGGAQPLHAVDGKVDDAFVARLTGDLRAVSSPAPRFHIRRHLRQVHSGGLR